MRMLAGLGNPGDQYQNTRHNIGFVVVETVAKELGADWKSFKNAEIAQVALDGEKIILCKPQSFMNRSGLALREVSDYFKIDELCIATDDVYLKPGSARIRKSGESGGHNGWKSVLEHFETDSFLRVKVGVGIFSQDPEVRKTHPPLDDYVLRPIPEEDQESVIKLIDIVVPNLVKWLRNGEMDHETFHI